MSVALQGYVNEASVSLRRGFAALARMLAIASDMNVQGTGIASLDSESQATGRQD
jgi:hypothetical protein